MGHSIDLYVGKSLRNLRKGKNLTLEEISKGLAISIEQLRKYEVGTNRISCSRIQEIANFFGVPVSYFFPSDSASVPGYAQIKTKSGLSDEETATFIKILSYLSVPVRKSLLAHIRVLAKVSEKSSNSSVKDKVTLVDDTSSIHFDITRPELIERINKGLQDLDISISELEKLASVPKDTIRDFLRGKSYILRADKYFKIIKTLSKSL